MHKKLRFFLRRITLFMKDPGISRTKRTTMAPLSLTSNNASYCYLDLDVNHYRSKLALAAAFVNATDARYGFSSPDLRRLGGSELARLPDLVRTDHEWASKFQEQNSGDSDNSMVVVKTPPTTPSGNRLVLQLDWDTAPLACENFATLCSNGGGDRSFVEQGTTMADSNNNCNSLPKKNKVSPPPSAPIGESGKPLTYRGSRIHRVIRNFVMQGGDFVFGNGSGGECVFEKKKSFKDERAGLLKKHDQRGLLSMGNSGKNSNTSQFFVTLGQSLPQCNGKHVIFGKVISGHDLLDHIETLASSSSSSDDGDGGTPTQSIVITDCGIWTPLITPAAGYWYDKPDPESFSGISPLFMVRPRVAVVAPNATAVDKFQKALAVTCVVSSVVMDDLGSTEVTSIIHSLLERFAVDVVLVAPACSKEVLQQVTQLPESWAQRQPGITLELVILEAKPVEALSRVRDGSWIGQNSSWPLDGVIQ